VNLILFEPSEIGRALPLADPRAIHLLQVLRRREGDCFDAGLVDGPRGKGTLTAVGAAAIEISFTWDAEPAPPDPVTLIIGLPRPQTARDILRDATALGVAAMHFVATEKGDPSYACSTLWSSGEWRRLLIQGAGQAFDTRLPQVTWGRPLAEIVASLPPEDVLRIGLDNYEASASISRCLPASVQPTAPAAVLAFGPERGWSARDRDVLRKNGFILAHLGSRVLRTESAVTAALAIFKAATGRL